MSLNLIDYIFLFGDYFVSILLLVYFIRAYQKKNISNYFIYAFFAGCLIGSTWELTFHFLGDAFSHSIKIWPWGLDGLPKKLSHSIWDGGLFMVGIWLCIKFLPGPHFTKFNTRELLLMEGWGIFQELLVEYLFNGRVWLYEELSWNPVIIPPLPGSATTVGYTFIPQAIWVVAPLVFYVLLIKLKNIYKE